MKIGRLLSLLLFLAILLSACQFGKPAATEYPAPAQDAPSLQYPYPGQDITLDNPLLAYPFSNEDNEIHWMTVRTFMQGGEVAKVIQTNDLKVIVTLKDGRSFVSWQPFTGEVLKAIEECGEICKDIAVENE